MLILHWTGIDTAQAMAALCIAAAALTPAAVFALARAVGPRRAPDPAGGAPRRPLPRGAALRDHVRRRDLRLRRGGHRGAALRPPPPVRAAGCAAFVVASLFSWALLAVGAFAAVVALRRDGVRAAAVLAAGCGAALVLGQGALALATGYDPIGTLAATEAYYRNSVASRRPYWFWVLGLARRLGRHARPPDRRGPPARRPAGPRPRARGRAVVGVAAVAGLHQGGDERIWLIFVPLACVAAAEALPPGRIRLLAAALAAQALVTAALFSTIW
jgi:hypothetical protein